MADTEGPTPLTVDIASNAPTPPSIAAIFLVKFDHRKGYVLDWQRSTANVSIEGAVELKSLPSGLHNVDEDLIYFVHEDYVGVSAYINKPDADSARGANMLAVGVLVPLQQGRMGKSWLHARGLKDIAKKMMENTSDTTPLETYWDESRIQDSKPPAPPDESTDDLFIPKNNANANGGYQKFRSMSASTALPQGTHTLAPHHPAATLLSFLDIFGPLIFPLYRFSLLRKRILIVTEAPVELANNIVYNLSILSSIPHSLLNMLPLNITPSQLRRKPLFTVGIIDIPALSLPSSEGWLACTTDDVLATKPECFDVLVFLPSVEARRARERVYPRIVLSTPELARQFPTQGVKATQRDAERYTILREGLRGYVGSSVEQGTPVEATGDEAVVDGDDEVADGASTLSTTSTLHDNRTLIEPASWSQVAYTSLLWWASAGDRRAGLSETEELEREMDLSLLETGNEMEGDGGDERTKEIVLVGFLRRLTGVLVGGVGEIVGAHQHEEVEGEDGGYKDNEEDDEEGQEVEDAEQNENENDDTQPLISPSQQRPSQPTPSKQTLQNTSTQDTVIEFTSSDISSLSLDPWSPSDRVFISEFVRVWWGKEGKVVGGGIECCGVKIM